MKGSGWSDSSGGAAAQGHVAEPEDHIISTSSAGASSIALVIFTLNHREFVADCLESIEREFPNLGLLHHVDLGSSDGTLEMAAHCARKLGLKVCTHTYPKGTTTLASLAALQGHVRDEFLVGISGDDAFGVGYGTAATHAVATQGEPQVVWFTLWQTDSTLRKVKRRVPLVLHSGKLMRLLMLSRNPGTGPGAILPWKAMSSWGILEDCPKDNLIEDYWLWLSLLDRAKFVIGEAGYVLYRRHPEALTPQLGRRDAGLSFARCGALAWQRADTSIERTAVLLRFLVWLRRVPARHWPSYARTFFES